MLDLLAKCDNTLYVLAAGTIVGMVQVLFDFLLPFGVAGMLVFGPWAALIYLVVLNMMISAITSMLFELFALESIGCRRRK